MPRSRYPRQGEHRMIQAMEPGQRDELELVSHAADRPAGTPAICSGRQLLLPVETGRAIIGQQLAGKPPVDRVREALRLMQVRLARLPPQQVGIGRVGQAAGDRVLHAQPGPDAEEAFRRSARRR